MKRSLGAAGGGPEPLRKLTATGTAGERGQLFAVYERNWQCKSCSQENYPMRIRCTRCKKMRPEDTGHDYVEDPALLALKAGKTHSWREAIDPSTKQMYYYNEETGLTQWDRPSEMGEAPSATGWFGRGQAGSDAATKYFGNNSKYLTAPAKKQKDLMDPKKYHTEGQNEYNIWYDRYVGDIKDKSSQREAAEDRCVVDRDAGHTKADKGGFNRKEKRSFCLHFARGICCKGADCTFYHRIPLPVDDSNCEEMFDCFGRQRHSSHRDDMNGVGSFMNPSRTLFVGGLSRSKYGSPKALEEALWRHFGEWGELENINVVYRLSIAFPRYRLRTSAEFAKEAMTCQALDCKEVLSIRWAKDDPNPIAQNSISSADKDALAAFLDARGVPTQELSLNGLGPMGGKVIESEHVTDYPELAYPDTDTQYGQSHVVSGSAVDLGPNQGTVVGSSGSIPSGHGSSLVASQQHGMVLGGDYGGFFSALYGAKSALSASSSSHQGGTPPTTTTIAGKDDSECSTLFGFGDILAKQRLLSSIGLEPYLNHAKSEEVILVGSVAGFSLDVAGDSEQKETVKRDEEEEEDEEEEDEDEEEGDEDDSGGWTAHTDPETGATYYYNASTGESSWGAPPVPLG